MSLFSSFLASNIPVIPLRGGIPQVEWSKYYEAPPSPEDAARWDAAGYSEVALLCGKVSGIIGLDIDTDDTDKIYMLAGATPLRKRGSKGFTAFYRYNGENSRSWGGVVELLSDKRLTTIPPSPHRKTGKPYVWMDGESWDNLPEISPDVFTFLEAKYPRKTYTPKPYDGPHDTVALDVAAEMLGYVSSDCIREDWIKIGMALRDEYGDAACQLWHDWSARASSRYDARAAQSAWRSFGGNGIGIGSLIYVAKQNGWESRREHEARREHVEEWTGEVVISEPEQAPEPEATPKAFPPHLLDAPNLLGEVAGWIESRATIPQPALSLAASIAMLGALLGHRIRSESDVRTNIYVLGVAESGQGKENARSCVKVLLRDIGKPQLALGEFASDVGLSDALYNGGGCGVSLIDEFGDYLASITGKSSGGWEKKITAAMKSIYGEADSCHFDKQRANQDGKEVKRRDIEQPCLCIYGTTTPKQFTDALSGKDVLDGFLPRWLIFETEYTRKKRKRGGIIEPPQRLLSLLSSVAQMPTDTRAQCADTVMLPAIVPQVVRFSREAQAVIDEFEALCDDRQEQEVLSGGGCNAIWARAHVSAIKLAMIASDFEEVREKETRWACEVAEYLTHRAVALAKENVADNDYHRLMNEVLQFLRTSPNMERSRRDIMRKFKRVEMRKIEDVLRHLCDSENLRVEERSNLRGKPSVVYFV